MAGREKMNRILRGIVLLAVLIGLGLFIYFDVWASGEDGGIKDLTTVELMDGGQNIDLNDYLGEKKLILQFVAVPCDCCSFTMPIIKELVAEQDEIDFVAIVFSGRKNKIQKKFEEYDLNYPWGLDLDKSIANHYRVTTSPTFVFFDEEGNHLGNYPYIISDKESLVKIYQKFLNDFNEGK